MESSKKAIVQRSRQSFNPNCPMLQSPSGTKKYFCIFCKQTYTKLKRHIERVHKKENEVKEMLQYPKGSAEREQILLKIRTRGTFAFNMNSEYNEGKIIVSRRPNPTLQRTTGDFIPCPYCGNYYGKRTLYRHTRRCSNHGGSERKLRGILKNIHPRANKIMVTQIIPRLTDDSVSEVVKSDELIILFGNYLTQKHTAPNRAGYIRQSLRTVAKLLLTLGDRNPAVTQFSTIYKPEYCDLVIRTIIKMVEFVPELNTFKLTELAKKMGPNIKRCGEIWSMECSKRKNFAEQKMVMDFLNKFTEMYRKQIWAKLPKTQDKTTIAELKKLFAYTQSSIPEILAKLKREFSNDVWEELVKCLLLHLRLLNNNVFEECETLQLSDYLQRSSLEVDEKLHSYHILDQITSFPENYFKVQLRGSPNTCFLVSPEFCEAADVLLEHREGAGVSPDNLYLFGCPGGEDAHYGTNDAKVYIRSKCNKAISSRKKTEVDETLPNSNVTYCNSVKKAFDQNLYRMLELRTKLSDTFTHQLWMELGNCVLTCVQLMNDKTFTEAVQYMLLDDYYQRQIVDDDEVLSIYNSFEKCEGFPENYVKVNLQGTPIDLLLSSEICNTMNLLIEGRSSANIHPKNPYVFACNGNKYKYYGSKDSTENLSAADGMDDILKVRSRIVNGLIASGTLGVRLSILVPDSKSVAVDDVTKLFYYSQTKMVELKYRIEESFSNETWLELMKCLLAHVFLLNNNVPEDPEKLLIADYNQRQSLDEDENENVYNSLDDLTDFPLNYCKVRMGQSSYYLLLSLDFCETVDLLLRNRREIGVHEDNPFVFGCHGDEENFFTAQSAVAHLALKLGMKCLKYSKRRKVNETVSISREMVNCSKGAKTLDSTNSSISKTSQFSDSSIIQRKRWSKEEVSVAMRHFSHYLVEGTLPSALECREIISANSELQGRTPEQLKAWVNNQVQKNVKQICDKNASSRIARCRWSTVERDIVKLAFAGHLEQRTLPRASECRQLIFLHRELKSRTVEQLRAWVNNQNKKKIS